MKRKKKRKVKRRMNSLQVFDNLEFGSIRTVTIDGEPWFVLLHWDIRIQQMP